MISAHSIGVTVIGVSALVLLILGALLAYPTPRPHSAVPSVAWPSLVIDRSDMPRLSHYAARDRVELAYRAYEQASSVVAVLVHGASASSGGMHALARALWASGDTVYALDMRGHGGSGRLGDIDYVGQLDDDVADFVATIIKSRHDGARLVLVGFSSGGGFALGIAGGPYGHLFDGYILLSPAITNAPSLRRGTGGGVGVNVPRIIGISILDAMGVHWFDGLTVLEFPVLRDPGFDVTRAYSMRLMLNFISPRLDYVRDVRGTTRPMILLAGTDDEVNIAERYAPELLPAKPDLGIEVLSGINHAGLIAQPAALQAIVAAVDGITK